MNLARMNTTLRYGTVALALLGGIGIAAAQSPSAPPSSGKMDNSMSQSGSTQTQLQLSAAQKSAIFKAIDKNKAKPAAAANFHPSVGATVPATIALYALPDNAVANAPQAKQLKYTMAQNQVVLVDPTSLKVVDIIRQ